MLKPRCIKAGDTIALVSPASPVSEEQIQKAVHLLESSGFRVRIGKHALEREQYLAGSDADRASDLQAAFDDPEIAAVLCSRGGYGCARLFPYIDLDRIAASQKLFIGFSDITVLHLALNRRGLATLYAPMALTLHYDREPWVIECFLGCLLGEPNIPAAAPKPSVIVGGTAVGQSAGGCLCLLVDSLGTPEPLDTEGRILFIEDVDEAPHRIDAMLTHLRNSGLLQKCAGIVVGEMTRTDEREDSSIGARPWREIVAERIGDLGVPCVLDFPFGHFKAMLSVPLGIAVRLDADAGSITYLERFYQESS